MVRSAAVLVDEREGGGCGGREWARSIAGVTESAEEWVNSAGVMEEWRRV